MTDPIIGSYMDRSLSAFHAACRDCIANEREKPLPDLHLIALLEDAVRLARELAITSNDCMRLRQALLSAQMDLRLARRAPTPA